MKFIIKENIKEIVNQFENQADIVQKQSGIQMYRALTILEAAIKQNIRVKSGLKVRSGTLMNSIQKMVEVKGNTVIGRVGPENVPYANIHEEGGVIPSHRIEPRHGKALRWMGGGGKFMFSKGHNLPDIKIPARPYLAPALADKAEVIREKFNLFISKAMETN